MEKELQNMILNIFKRYTLFSKLAAGQKLYYVTLQPCKKALSYFNGVNFLALTKKLANIKIDDKEMVMDVLK